MYAYGQARLRRPDLVADLQHLYVDSLQRPRGLKAEQVWQAEDRRPSRAFLEEDDVPWGRALNNQFHDMGMSPLRDQDFAAFVMPTSQRDRRETASSVQSIHPSEPAGGLV